MGATGGFFSQLGQLTDAIMPGAKEAREQAAKQAAQQDKLIKDAEAKKKKDEVDENAINDRAAARTLTRESTVSKSPNILTSSLGVTDTSANGAGKTLLGM